MTANRVQSFSSLDFDWTAPVTELAKEGVNVTSSTFNTSLSNEGTELSITYRVQVSFYHGNGTAMNGEQIIDVPGRDKKIERVELQSSIFLDSPVLAQIGAQMVTINSSVAVVNDFVIVEYEFPKFTSRYTITRSHDLECNHSSDDDKRPFPGRVDKFIHAPGRCRAGFGADRWDDWIMHCSSKNDDAGQVICD
uniref:Uncharacterized protein n=1 Tax=Globisporangium ultimum (strain ATCC 200006 / CBS 805.95 / DAOM BR144) TaxID=431595 RepID=K3WZ27_GLOUD